MKGWLRHGIGLVCLAAAAALWCLALLEFEGADRYDRLYLFRPESESIDLERLDGSVTEETAGGVLLWKEEKNRLLENRELSRQTSGCVIRVWGAAQLLVPEAGILNYLPEKSCVLDEETAQALFGSTDAAGKQVCFEGEAYTVAGTVKTGISCMICPAGKNETLSYGACERLSGETGEETRRRLQAETGIDAKALSLGPFQAKRRTGLFLPFFLLFLFLLKKLRGRERRGYPDRRVYVVLWLVFFLLAALWYGISFDSLPSDITTLGGWKEWLGEKKALFLFFRERGKSLPELLAMEHADRVLGLGAGAAAVIAAFLYFAFLI